MGQRVTAWPERAMVPLGHFLLPRQPLELGISAQPREAGSNLMPASGATAGRTRVEDGEDMGMAERGLSS